MYFPKQMWVPHYPYTPTIHYITFTFILTSVKTLDCSEICRHLNRVKCEAWQVAAIWFPISFTSCGHSSSRVPFRCQDSKTLINVLSGTRQSPPRPLNTSTPSAQTALMPLASVFQSRTSGGVLAAAERLSKAVSQCTPSPQDSDVTWPL